MAASGGAAKSQGGWEDIGFEECVAEEGGGCREDFAEQITFEKVGDKEEVACRIGDGGCERSLAFICKEEAIQEEEVFEQFFFCEKCVAEERGGRSCKQGFVCQEIFGKEEDTFEEEVLLREEIIRQEEVLFKEEIAG